jgi:hypothetical protein
MGKLVFTNKAINFMVKSHGEKHPVERIPIILMLN